MAKSLRTFVVDFSLPSKTVAPDIVINISSDTTNTEILHIETSSKDFPLNSETVKTMAVKAHEGEISITNVPLYVEGDTGTLTTGVSFQNVTMIETKSVEIVLPPPPETFDVACRPPEKVETFYSPYLENAPISREMLDLKMIPYPLISEYIIALAERNNTNYTNISLIGIFDPVPVHLATGLTIDTERGVLKYFIRETPVEVQGPRIARVVYGRMRMTGEIVSAVLPSS